MWANENRKHNCLRTSKTLDDIGWYIFSIQNFQFQFGYQFVISKMKLPIFVVNGFTWAGLVFGCGIACVCIGISSVTYKSEQINIRVN